MKGIDIAYSFNGTTQMNKFKLMSFFDEFSINRDIYIDPTKLNWCAAFANGCERATGRAGTGKNVARSFRNYEKEVSLKEIQYGDLVLFKRGLPWQGHITYFVKFGNKEKTHLVCIGGNQNKMVCESSFNIKNLIGVRRS